METLGEVAKEGEVFLSDVKYIQWTDGGGLEVEDRQYELVISCHLTAISVQLSVCLLVGLSVGHHLLHDLTDNCGAIPETCDP